MTERRDRDRRDQRMEGLYIGRVTRRDDPDGLGRVKVEIPGVAEPESTWAWPLGPGGGGSAQRGDFDPPAVDSTVGVLFNQGEVDEPYYLTGPWGAPGGSSDVPTGAQVGTGDDARDRQVAVREDAEWRITRNSLSASPEFLIEHAGSTTAIKVDGTKVYLGETGATDAAVKGTAFFSDLNTFLAALKTFVTSLSALPGQAGPATTFNAALDALVAQLPNDLAEKVNVK